MITPFGSAGPDEAQMKKLIAFQRESGTAALVIAGTTGENATLDIHEYQRLVDFSVRAAEGSMKMIVGIGGNCTERCLEKARFAQAAGADAVLMTTPYYNKTTLSGLIRHFSVVADGIGILKVGENSLVYRLGFRKALLLIMHKVIVILIIFA